MPKNTDTPSGFSQWIEIFRAGTQTDSKGRKRTFTQDELDSIIANHSADDPAPIVIGHPKENAPAYGWTAGLRRVGDTLLAQFSDVVPEFAAACKKRLYRKRSVSIEPTEDGGWRLNHVGFLGAAAPAVKGLKDMAFSVSDDAYEFEATADGLETVMAFAAPERTMGWALSALARVMRRMRDRLIASDGLEAADKELPDYEIDSLSREAQRLLDSKDSSYNAPLADLDTPITPQSKTNPEEPAMPGKKTFAADDVAGRDAYIATLERQTQNAKQREVASQFAAAVTKAQALIDAKLSAGVLTPAQAQGLAEFMAHLPDNETSAFEFTAADNTTDSQTPFAFFSSLLERLGTQVSTGKRNDNPPDNRSSANYSSRSGLPVDEERAELHKKALEYQKQHQGVDYVSAVQAVSEED
ncbi:hypothetical protein [Shewanella xiamenensis]|uniref:hypothetical protein n=1 Tax=Shewanella xiamenensis TaxID=332186 RepID=UPI0009B7D5DD|nr:hypothetical protein [Shewanella xiamenensis]